MSNNITFPQVALAGMVAAFGSLWGKIGWLIFLCLAAMAFDYLTGTLAALHMRTWSSKIAVEGIWHKAGMLVVIIVAAMFDIGMRHIAGTTGIILPFDLLALPIILSWYIITELGSILENAVKMGAERVPKWLKEGLAIAADTIDKTGEREVGKSDKHENEGGAKNGNGSE